MSGMTYEKNPIGALETYEWDNTWWHKNQDLDHPRIMTLGDSISWGTKETWCKLDAPYWYIDNCATSKAVDNPYLLDLVRAFHKQQVRCDAVLVNNGLHGWHLSTEEYAFYYEKLLAAMKKEFDGIPIIMMLTTCVTNDAEREELVKERNAAAIKIAEKLALPVIDLYTLSLSLIHTDGVHLNSEGYIAICNKITEELHKILE